MSLKKVSFIIRKMPIYAAAPEVVAVSKQLSITTDCGLRPSELRLIFGKVALKTFDLGAIPARWEA